MALPGLRNKIDQVNKGIVALSTLKIEAKDLRDGDIDLLLDSLKGDVPIRGLDMYDCRLGDDFAFLLAEALKENKTLRRLELVANGFSPKGITAIAQALETHPHITAVNFGTNNIGDEGAIAVAELARKNTRVIEVGLHKGEVGDDGAAAVAAMMLERKDIRHIQLNLNPITDKGAVAFLAPLQNNLKLTSFFLQVDGCSENMAERLADTVEANENKNLIACPMGIGRLTDYLAHNSTLRSRYREALRNADSVEELTTGELYEIYTRYPAIDRDIQSIPRSKFPKLLDALPAVDANSITKPEDLITTQPSGFTPLDNPRIWENFSAICGKLKSAGTPLTMNHLNRENRDGETFLITALKHGPLEQLVEGLNASGIQLRNAELLNEDSKPSPLLEAALENAQIRFLFTSENWAGASSGALRATLRALPKERLENIPGRHTLFADFNRNSERGRSR